MIKVLLWDIDGTLLNFLEAEKYAIRKCFSVFHLGICTDEMLAKYSKINDKYWKMLERGEITKPEVLYNRFAEFFQTENIEFDEIDAFNAEYQVSLGDKIFFNDNSYPLVKKFKNRVKQYAVTNGTLVAQKRKLERSGLGDLFDGVFISECIGTAKPKKEFFDFVMEKIGTYSKDEIMIVGDSLTSDMLGGVNAGIKCCWYNPYGEENKLGLELDYEVHDLNQIDEIVESTK